MKNFTTSLSENKKIIKSLLPSEDVLSFAFQTSDQVDACLFYADGMVNKELLGELTIRPISAAQLKNEGGRVALNEKTVQFNTRFPEWKVLDNTEQIISEILDGNTLL